MKVTLKTSDKIQEFNNAGTIVIGKDITCDFVLDDLKENVTVKLVYSDNYKNYVLINTDKNPHVTCNGKSFIKALIPPYFSLVMGNCTILITVEHDSVENFTQNTSCVAVSSKTGTRKATDIFNNQIEKNRVAIVKEIGHKIEELKATVKSLNNINLFLNAGLVILSVVCSFAMTNFLLGLKADTTSSVLNLTTNFGFLTGLSIIVFAIALVLKFGVYSVAEFNRTKRLGDSDIVQKFIVFIACIFMFMVYIINLFYYKDLPGLSTAAFFISILFVGGLATTAIAGGYVKSRLKEEMRNLTDSEFREDFESVIKQYRNLIESYVNSLSQNRINAIRGSLVNNQIKMVFETAIGILTTPFLAYGVSNTLASCFPEAANWVRISGLRISPIFLTLATFLIMFAFFVFVSAFTISKQIKSSEIIKFDGFHDYNSHGVTIYGVDSTKSMNKEKSTLLFIACTIILIEFTMNVSYFVTELGGDIQGMFLSVVTALVPTALLIAETNLLSGTMHRIHNYNELLAMLD